MPYAIVRNGQAVELDPALPFTTYELMVTTEEEAAWSFTPIGQYAPCEVIHAAGSLAGMDSVDRARFRIVRSDPPTPAPGHTAQYQIIVQDGAPLFIWSEVSTGPQVPVKVSRMQAKMALLGSGLLAAVEAAIAASDDAALKLYWAEASDFHRDHPALNGMTAVLGMTSEQVDDLFIAASQIT